MLEALGPGAHAPQMVYHDIVCKLGECHSKWALPRRLLLNHHAQQGDSFVSIIALEFVKGYCVYNTSLHNIRNDIEEAHSQA